MIIISCTVFVDVYPQILSCKQISLKERILHIPTQPHPYGYACVRGRPQSYKDWHRSQLEQACNAVMRDALPMRRAAELFSIPRSTLHDHISGRVPQGSSSGPPKYLSTEEEEELVQFLQTCAEIGFARNRQQVILLVQCVVNKKGKSYKWMVGFIQTPPQGTSITYSRAAFTYKNAFKCTQYT